ncbi:hypothetical protein ZWY2020_036572 [Hordeum vulgare]|nr:hypothetical protein ZWY2020_036572 [Hordeum vulgare]
MWLLRRRRDGDFAFVAEVAAMKKVSSEEGTVNNEFLGRKSSKKCCIFHKEMSFKKDCSDNEGGHRNLRGGGIARGQVREGRCSSSTVGMNTARDTTTELCNISIYRPTRFEQRSLTCHKTRFLILYL